MARTFPDHAQKVHAIAGAIRERVGRGAPVHIAKGGVSHVVPLPANVRLRGQPIDISTLNRVLLVDPAEKVCVAEPGVPFSQLVPATLEHGLIPAVVPELEGITLGGAVAGCSVESQSFKYGGFHDQCLEYEVITGEGDVLTLSPEQDPLAFHMMHGSYGTLGVLSRLTFRLFSAKRFVRLRYERLPTVDRFFEAMMGHCQKGDHDFIDGIIHGPDELLVCLGDFVDDAPYVSSYRWLDIYYKSTRARDEDFLSTCDYCFRYDTECHWLTRTVPPLEWKPTRLLFGKLFLGSTNLIRWSKRLDRVLRMKRRPEVVCDVFIPSRNFVEFYRWYEETFRFFPLWIVPYRIERPYPWISERLAGRGKDEMFIDCAVYGKANSEPDVDYSQILEDKTHALDGLKTLIGRNHYTEQSFWEVYHRPNYESVKRRLDPRGIFPGLFDKLHRV